MSRSRAGMWQRVAMCYMQSRHRRIGNWFLTVISLPGDFVLTDPGTYFHFLYQCDGLPCRWKFFQCSLEKQQQALNLQLPGTLFYFLFRSIFKVASCNGYKQKAAEFTAAFLRPVVAISNWSFLHFVEFFNNAIF